MTVRAPVKPMKISELSRHGSQNFPQAFGDYIKRDEQGNVSLCFLGAVFLSLTGKLPPNDCSVLDIIAEHVEFVPASYPVEMNRRGKTNNPLGFAITLNDVYHWPVDKIAAWFEQNGM